MKRRILVLSKGKLGKVRRRIGARASLLLLVLVAWPAMAQLDTARYIDHPFIAGFPNAVIIDYDLEQDTSYRFVLSSLKRTQGTVTAENVSRHQGHLSKLTYEIADGFSGADVHDFYQQEISERGYERLFSCIGRSCGSSNYWANDIFGKRTLYGPQRNQFYQAFRGEDDAGNDVLGALYIITRGNKRTYAYLEILDSTDAPRLEQQTSAEAWLNRLSTQGSATLNRVRFDDQDRLEVSDGLKELAELMRVDENMAIYLVAHLRSGEVLAEQLQRSQRRADLARQELLTLGVSSERVTSHGVGPLAPACRYREGCPEPDRLEVVLP